jgi:hypothetical protein
MYMYLFTRACLALALLLFFRTGLSAAGDSLAIVNAGIAQEDNGALAPHDYQFLPSDPLFVVFEISGFQINRNEEKDTRSISLTWEVSLLDDAGRPLAEPQSGTVKTGLSPEDKKWIPKRRAQFSLPELIAAGKYHVHIAAKDLLGNTETAQDIPFLIGGRSIAPSASVGTQHIAFSRTEGGPPLSVAAYQPGDSVFLSFDLTGFSDSPSHEYRISYRFDILGPDGKVFVHQREPVLLSGTPFYPAPFVPANFAVDTPPKSPRGKYTIVLTVRDELSKQSSTDKYEFTLE